MALVGFAPFSDPGNNVRLELNAGILAGDTSVVLKAPVSPYNKVPALTRDNLNSTTTMRPGLITLSNLAGTVIEVATYTSVTDNADGTQTLGGLTRGLAGTTAVAWNAGDIAYQDLTAATISKINRFMASFGYNDADAAPAFDKIFLDATNDAVVMSGKTLAVGSSHIAVGVSNFLTGTSNKCDYNARESLAAGTYHRVYGASCAVFGAGGVGYLEGALTAATIDPFGGFMAQATRLHRGAKTTDATTISVPGNTPVELVANSVLGFTGTITAYQYAGTAGVVGEVKVWTVSGVIKNVAGVVSFVGTPTVTVLAADTNTTAWAVSLVADDGFNKLDVRFTGEANKSIAVSVLLDCAEAGNPSFAAIS